jgi:hypothetical protein
MEPALYFAGVGHAEPLEHENILHLNQIVPHAQHF